MVVIEFIRLIMFSVAMILLILNMLLSAAESIRQYRIKKERYEKTNIKRLRP